MARWRHLALVALVVTAGCSPRTPSVEFISPKEGAVVRGRVRLEMVARGIKIEPIGGPLRRNAGHFHVMVDRPCFRADAFIELHTEGFEHFGNGATSATLDLQPGRHTLCLQVGNTSHVTMTPSHEVSFTVSERRR